MTTLEQPPTQKREDKVKDGLDFILDHFSIPWFPRKISRTTIDRRQYEVDSKDRAMLYYRAALWQDCRLNVFSVGQTNPDLIFIDIDATNFESERALKLALTRTLNNIDDKLDGAHPTVTWSGRGYHIIQPIECNIPLEKTKDFTDLDPYPSNKFLQFAERYLSNGKSDPSHNPALNSCLLRVPGTINSKNGQEVKVLQEWDKHRPDVRLLLGSFHADLIGKYYHNNYSGRASVTRTTTTRIIVKWIEKLLQTPITDYRKHTRDLIIIPYLIVCRGMTDKNEICGIVMKWADKCDELGKLEPSRSDFSIRTRSRIDEVMRDRVPPMSFDTLKQKCPALWEKLND